MDAWARAAGPRSSYGRIHQWICVLSVLMASGLVLGCSSPDAPRPLPTVLVTNATCDAGRCATLEIRAFIWKFPIPTGPWGEEVLGETQPGQACLAFPPSWSSRIIGSDTTGRVDTAITTWTPADTVPIYLIAVDSVLFHSRLDSAVIDSLKEGLLPYFDGLVKASVGETPNFAPGVSPGWSVTFPSAPQWGAKLVPGESCKP